MRRNDNLSGTADNSASEQVPGFLVLIVPGILAVGVEKDFGKALDYADGEDVPGVGGNDIRGDEVDLVGSVGDAVGFEAAAVGIPSLLHGAFDLDAAEVSAMVGGDVVQGCAPNTRFMRRKMRDAFARHAQVLRSHKKRALLIA